MNYKTYLFAALIVALIILMFYLAKNDRKETITKFYKLHKVYLEKNFLSFSNKEFCIRFGILLIMIICFVNVFINTIIAIILLPSFVVLIMRYVKRIKIENKTITINNKSFNIYAIEDLKFKITHNKLVDKKQPYVNIYLRVNGKIDEYSFKTFTVQAILCLILMIELIRTNEEDLKEDNLEKMLNSCEIK